MSFYPRCCRQHPESKWHPIGEPAQDGLSKWMFHLGLHISGCSYSKTKETDQIMNFHDFRMLKLPRLPPEGKEGTMKRQDPEAQRTCHGFSIEKEWGIFPYSRGLNNPTSNKASFHRPLQLQAYHARDGSTFTNLSVLDYHLVQPNTRSASVIP